MSSLVILLMKSDTKVISVEFVRRGLFGSGFLTGQGLILDRFSSSNICSLICFMYCVPSILEGVGVTAMNEALSRPSLRW